MFAASTSPYALSCNDDFLLFSITSMIIGVAINAITANITITANNSTNVNPFLFILTSPNSILYFFILSYT